MTLPVRLHPGETMRLTDLKAPNAFVLIFGIMVVMACLTWVIPGGQYERVEKERRFDANTDD